MNNYNAERRSMPNLIERGIAYEFEAHYRNTLEGTDLILPSGERVRAVVQGHSNPINSHLEDKLMLALNKECSNINWGEYLIDAKTNKMYIVLTNPESTDGVVTKCKIRKVENKCSFTIDSVEYTYNCIGANSLLYDGTTYKTDTVVFEDDDRKSIVVEYNEHTSKIDYIDTVYFDGVKYKAILIQHLINSQGNGVIQMVLIRTLWGDVFRNGELIDVILTFARMKDKKLNSKSRQIICRHNTIKTGDYIDYKYSIKDTNTDSDKTELRTYITITIPDVKLDYDIIYSYQCESFFNMWDSSTGEPVSIPCYVDDNFIKLEDKQTNLVSMFNAQYRIIVQSNSFTNILGGKVERIIMNKRAYKIVGYDDISMNGVVYIGLVDSKIDPNRDNIELQIGDYVEQYEEPTVEPSKEFEITGQDTCIISCTYTYENSLGYDTEWEVLSGMDYCNFNVVGNSLQLTIANNSKFIGKKIEIQGYCMGTVKTKSLVITGWR